MINKSPLIEAISSRRLINCTYDDHLIRNAAPHAIYMSTAGNECLDAFQYDGYSKSGNLPDWRNFKLEKIHNLEILDTKFEIAKGYNPYSTKYQNSIYKV